MIYIIIILLLFFLFFAIFYKIENYCGYGDINTYSSDIYAIRPPYQMAKKYVPEKLGPYRILKYNFLNIPIEG